MKLFYSAASPYVRKCLVAARELGLHDASSSSPPPLIPSIATAPSLRTTRWARYQLLTDEDTVLYDSRVICEYLNALGNGKLVPHAGPARWDVLVEQSLADGILDAAVLTRYETVLRPEALRWKDWITGQLEKVTSGLDQIERRATRLGDRVDFGTIAVGCALGYLDFRFASLGWRDKHPNASAWFERFGARASMVATRPAA